MYAKLWPLRHVSERYVASQTLADRGSEFVSKLVQYAKASEWLAKVSEEGGRIYALQAQLPSLVFAASTQSLVHRSNLGSPPTPTLLIKMLFTTSLLVAAGLLSTTFATPLTERQNANDGFGLSIGGGFDINYLQTFRLSYANSSAYIGQIKYQEYSEPLVVQGADIAGAQDGLYFLSIHSAPTGGQQMVSDFYSYTRFQRSMLTSYRSM